MAKSQLQQAKLTQVRHRQALSLHTLFSWQRKPGHDLKGSHKQPWPQFRQVAEGERTPEHSAEQCDSGCSVNRKAKSVKVSLYSHLFQAFPQSQLHGTDHTPAGDLTVHLVSWETGAVYLYVPHQQAKFSLCLTLHQLKSIVLPTSQTSRNISGLGLFWV